MRARSWLVAILFSTVSACGYQWQGTSNPWKSEGIEKIYIEALANSTLKSGMEVGLTSALVKEFSKGKRIRLVNDKKEADAVLTGTLDLLDSRSSGDVLVSTTSTDLDAQALDSAYVAAEYSLTAAITLKLERTKDHKLVWSQSFARSKSYPSNNIFGPRGNTAVLINSSREKMALDDLSVILAADAHDTMMEAF